MTARLVRSHCTLAGAWLFAAGSALAAPPVGAPAELHGPIEACTVANFQETDVPCELCPPSDKDSGACGQRLSGLGYVKKCETRLEMAEPGEVWCKSKRPAAAPNLAPVETQDTLRLVVLGAAAALVLVVVYFRKDWAKRRS